MFHLVRTWLQRIQRRPVLAVIGVGLLSGSFLLPTVHHFCDHHVDAGSDDCPVCLFAAVGVAVPAVAWVDHDLSAAGLAVVPVTTGSGDRPAASAPPRAPPLSG